MTTTDDIDSAEPTGGALRILRDGHVVRLEIDHPRRANALTPVILDALARAVGDDAIGTARAVILTGAGERHFSSGVDLSSVAAEDLPDHLRAEEERLGGAAAALEHCAVPVIAALNGAAFGGALELASACDWRVAIPSATLGMPAARIGVAYSYDGLRRFVRLLGPARARRIFLSGMPIGAQEAFALGLVDHLTPAGASAADVAAEAALAVAGSSPGAIRATRDTITSLAEGGGADARQRAETRRVAVFASADFREGLAAFREKRPPDFSD